MYYGNKMEENNTKLKDELLKNKKIKKEEVIKLLNLIIYLKEKYNENPDDSNLRNNIEVLEKYIN